MMISWKRTAKATLLGLGLMSAASNQADAGLILSAEAAGVQASTVSGVTTESFNEYTAGKYTSLSGVATPVGTLSSPGVAIQAADQYGGAGGSGNYFAIGSESGTTSATLALNGAQAYFGFWWSAADANNSIDFYSAGKYLGSFSAAAAMAALGSAYNGNPNSGADSGEKFAYLNVTGTNGTTIDQVVFRNSTLSTGFELDNLSIKATDADGPSGTIISNGILVPEPSSLVMASIAGLIGTGTWLGNRRRTAAKA